MSQQEARELLDSLLNSEQLLPFIDQAQSTLAKTGQSKTGKPFL